MNRTGSTVVSRGFPAFSHEGQCGNHPFHQSVNVTFNRWKGMFDQSYCKHGPKRLARVFQSCESDAARAALFEMPAPLTGPSSPALVFVLIVATVFIVTFFFLMFVTSLSTRRTVKDHFYQVRPRPISTPISTPISHGPPRPRPISREQINAIRTALFEENFGDYNEKAFSDIGTPRAARTTAAHRAPWTKAHMPTGSHWD